MRYLFDDFSTSNIQVADTHSHTDTQTHRHAHNVGIQIHRNMHVGVLMGLYLQRKIIYMIPFVFKDSS